MIEDTASVIRQILHEVRPECDFEKSSNFIEDGLLDSFDVVTIVSKIEKVSGISIQGEDVTPENFKNFEMLYHLIKKGEKQHGL